MTTSDAHRRAQRELSPDGVVLHALEITHPDVPAPVRVVNDAEDRTIDGETYTALRFGLRLAPDAEGRTPRAELVVDNVGRPLTQWIERSGGGSGSAVRVMEFLAGQSSPEWELTLELANVHVDQQQVTASIGYEALLGRRSVRLRHDPETSPGLF